ncbi:flap endonuclease-1 [Candidatus Woesearchaeota archaeon]|nr:flap endonuclease-1 [Candidatus Woesearchaeota archaeon]
MGLKFKELVVKKETSIRDLNNKIVVIDTFNYLYQFITTIRGRDGSPLTDSKGNATSHLIGLFNRTTKLMEHNVKLAFVFDGPPPKIKQRTRELRAKAKKQAALRLKEAEKLGDTQAMYKFASRTAILTPHMVTEAKQLISYLGLPVIQAPSEGEAQCAYMVKKGDAYASISQDYDSLIFSCPTLIRNLSIEGRRKRAGRFAYQIIKPEMLTLSENLNNLGLDIDQLIVLAILVGTDYNPGGIKGIGPKTAFKLIKEFPNNFDALFQKAEWQTHSPDLDWKEIFYTIKNMPTTDDYSLEWNPIDEEKLFKLLVEEHDFSAERVKTKLEKLQKQKENQQQKGLSSFF